MSGRDEARAGVVALVAEDAVELERVADRLVDLQHHLVGHEQQVHAARTDSSAPRAAAALRRRDGGRCRRTGRRRARSRPPWRQKPRPDRVRLCVSPSRCAVTLASGTRNRYCWWTSPPPLVSSRWSASQTSMLACQSTIRESIRAPADSAAASSSSSEIAGSGSPEPGRHTRDPMRARAPAASAAPSAARSPGPIGWRGRAPTGGRLPTGRRWRHSRWPPRS